MLIPFWVCSCLPGWIESNLSSCSMFLQPQMITEFFEDAVVPRNYRLRQGDPHRSRIAGRGPGWVRPGLVAGFAIFMSSWTPSYKQSINRVNIPLPVTVTVIFAHACFMIDLVIVGCVVFYNFHSFVGAGSLWVIVKALFFDAWLIPGRMSCSSIQFKDLPVTWNVSTTATFNAVWNQHFGTADVGVILSNFGPVFFCKTLVDLRHCLLPNRKVSIHKLFRLKLLNREQIT